MCNRDLQHNHVKTLDKTGKSVTESTLFAKVIEFVCQKTATHFMRRNGWMEQETWTCACVSRWLVGWVRLDGLRIRYGRIQRSESRAPQILTLSRR